MDAQQIKGKEKVRFRDTTSDGSVQIFKRTRQSVPETMPGDVPEQQNHHAFWKIRDKEGWKHGIMVDKNRQHWKCRYCSVTGRSGGISGLKRHLVGYRRAKCISVPEDVSAEIKKLIDDRKDKRRKRAAPKGAHKEEATNSTNAELQKTAHEPAFITSSEPWDLVPSTSHGLISDVQKDWSSILRESAQGSMVWAHVPGGSCYCSFCTLERGNEGLEEYEETVLRLLQRKMVQVVDMMLSAAEQLNAEELIK